MSEDFLAKLEWQRSDAPFEYESYSRQYKVSFDGKPDVLGSAAPSFKGDGSRYNPEDLMIASLAGCHMLTYLALASKMRVEVVGYADSPSAILDKAGKTSKITSMTLRPKVTILDPTLVEKASQLHEKAHEYCFIAQSVNFTVKIEPEIVLQ